MSSNPAPLSRKIRNSDSLKSNFVKTAQIGYVQSVPVTLVEEGNVFPVNSSLYLNVTVANLTLPKDFVVPVGDIIRFTVHHKNSLTLTVEGSNTIGTSSTTITMNGNNKTRVVRLTGGISGTTPFYDLTIEDSIPTSS
jgi:hypothetical protein